LYAICLSPSGYRTGCDLSPFSGKETIAALMQVNGSDAAHLLHRYLEFRDLVPAAFTAIALSPSPNEHRIAPHDRAALEAIGQA